jgi:hypothetical protein
MRTDGRDGRRLREQSMKLFSSVLSIVFQRQGRFCLQNLAIVDEAFAAPIPHRHSMRSPTSTTRDERFDFASADQRHALHKVTRTQGRWRPIYVGE